TIDIARTGDSLVARVTAADGVAVGDLRLVAAAGATDPLPDATAEGAGGAELTVVAGGGGVHRFAALVGGEPIEAAYHVDYPAAFAPDALDGAAIDALRQATGGMLADIPEAAFPPSGRAIAWQRAWQPFVVLAALLFLGELFIRYAAPAARR